MKSKVVFMAAGAHLRATAVSLAVAALAAACGGGGGSAVDTKAISGVALTGAALKQTPISIIDSTGKACATTKTGDDGSWTASLTACGAGPYLIKASTTNAIGQSVDYFSAATVDEVNGAAKILVSQVTDVLVKLALRTDVPTDVGSASLTADKLKDASAQLLAGLVPTEVSTSAGIDSTKDIRTTAVVAGSGQGLDKLHDRMPEFRVTKAGSDLQIIAKTTGFGSSGLDSAVVGATVPAGAAVGTALTAPTGSEISGVAVVSKANATADKIAAQPLADRVKGEVSLMLAAWDKVYTTAVPTDAATAVSFEDVCRLDDGWDKAALITEWNNDVPLARAANAYRVGAVRSNLKVVSVERSADNKSTVAVVRYDITYQDGSRNIQSEHVVIAGDSSAKCAERGIGATGATGQTGSNWRFLGNGRQVGVYARPVNALYFLRKLTDGSSNGANARQNRINFWVQDYRDKGVTYIIVKGPTLPSAGLKMLSPMVMRDASELQGKTGNYKNYDENNNAQMCSYRYTSTSGTTATGWDADKADCVSYGGSGNAWMGSDAWIDSLPTDATYTFDLYKDDGWKTVNGQSGKTPAYSYTSKLPSKPFKSTELTEANFPQVTTDNGLEFLNLAKGAGGKLKFDISAPITPTGAEKFATYRAWQYMQGSLASNTNGATWPRNRYLWNAYPNGTGSIAGFEFGISGKPAELGAINYLEGVVRATDRNGRYFETITSFQ